MQGRTEGLPPPGQSADWTIDQNWHGHTTVEHATWKALFERQGRLLPGRARDEFVRGMRDLPIGPGQIPDFRRLSEVLMRRTGWQGGAGPGARRGVLRAGIASSFTESVFALDSPSPNRIAFDLERVMRTRYRIDDFQESYFVIGDLDELLALASIDFAPIYQRTQGQCEFEPGQLIAGDVLLVRGSGVYHDARRKTG